METSILKTVKKILGLADDYTVFDLDIITYINSTFLTLNQLGVGPLSAYAIEGDEEKWEDFLGPNDQHKAVQTYVATKVRLLFDPPQTSYAIESLTKLCQELEWRFDVQDREVSVNAR